MPGRPTKLTPELHDLIVGLIRAGHYKETAATAAGIDRTTLYNWLRWGETEAEATPDRIDPAEHTIAQLRQLARDRGADTTGARTKVALAERINDATPPPSPFLDFFHALREAEAQAEVYAVKAMIEVGRDDWRMWLEYLARTRPATWARRDRPSDDEAIWGGTEEDAEKALERASEIVIKQRQLPA